jgi:hexosaminidase
MERGAEAVRLGHEVVMTPTSHCYFDHYQGDPNQEPTAFGGYTPLSQVYDFEPVPAELPTDLQRQILGVQANLWSEYLPTSKQAEYMLLPRLAALAEVAWSASDQRNWADFERRLRGLRVRYDAMGLTYRRDESGG